MPKGYVRTHLKNRIALWRERRGFTQIELARRLRVTPNTVCNWENGRSRPAAEMLPLLAKVLRTTVEELFLP